MSATKIFSVISLLGSLLIAGNTAGEAATGSDSSKAASALPMTQEEIGAKRKALREATMLPSLSGIKGIAYRVVGFKNYEPLDAVMAGKLQQLSIKKIPLTKADGTYKDCDAVVQITFAKAGAHTIAELKVTQWVALARNPKISVRAVTYSDRLFSIGAKPEQSVEELTNEFVIDFLKANQKGFEAESKDVSKDGAAKSSKK